MIIKKQLAELKDRLKQVEKTWTVDNYESHLHFSAHILPKIMNAEGCTIYIVEMGTEKICSLFGTGIKKKQIEPPKEGSIVGEVISTGKGIIRNNLEIVDGFHPHVEAEAGFSPRSIICYPITSRTNSGVTGAIQLLNKKGGPFLCEDLLMLEEITDYLSTSIESIILNREILRISNQLNEDYELFAKRDLLSDTLFVAESPAMHEVISLVETISETPVSILIQGENGTGKELIARLIHQSSKRKDGPFIAVNCSAIPERLVESEFFGFEKGAFTDAKHRRIGRFEEAKGGTLLLDEIGDMPLSIQPKFLRAIQENEGSRLGSNSLIEYDFRLLCSTNKDLRMQLEDGTFREDLFFRLFSIEIQVPPLRDRIEDIVPLSAAFLDEICKKFNKKIKGFLPEVICIFKSYSWPGNIRQLRHEIERLVALTPEGHSIGSDSCSLELLGIDKEYAAYVPGLKSTLRDQVEELEIRLITNALKTTQNNRKKAAELLGISRQGLHKKLKRYAMHNPYVNLLAKKPPPPDSDT